MDNMTIRLEGFEDTNTMITAYEQAIGGSNFESHACTFDTGENDEHYEVRGHVSDPEGFSNSLKQQFAGHEDLAVHVEEGTGALIISPAL